MSAPRSVPYMKNSECQLLVVLGDWHTPLAPSLTDCPDRVLCACLDVSGWHIKKHWVFFKG